MFRLLLPLLVFVTSVPAAETGSILTKVPAEVVAFPIEKSPPTIARPVENQ